MKLLKQYFGELKRWLTYKINFDLAPNETVEIDSGYKWKDDDPYFIDRSSIKTPLFGFYILEVTVSGWQSSSLSTLYLDIGHGFDAANQINVPIKSSSHKGCKTYKRVCYFTHHTKALRWDPSEYAGSANTIEISLAKLSTVYAKKLMLKKLSGFEVCQKLDKLALYKRYDQLFNTNIHSNNYQHWLDLNDSKQKSVSQNSQPLKFSIIVPCYNTQPSWLSDCVNSVKAQSYHNWQLILVDDASTSESTKSALASYEPSGDNADSRIKVVFRTTNGHISAASNSGLQLADGDYVLFLDHDDMLTADALAAIASCLQSAPDTQIVYSDEDLIQEDGTRSWPHFKSDWNPDLLLSHNYITHIACYKKSLIDQLGGMREGYEGAQDYDLILRASQIVAAENIQHLPKVLYHWRMVEGSTATDAGAKSYATDNGLKALQDYFQSTEQANVSVEHDKKYNFYRVNWSLPEDKASWPKVSVFIPTRDYVDILKICIDGLIEKTDYPNLEIIVVDNGSTCAATLSYLEQIKYQQNVKVIRDDSEFNYSYLNNLASRHASGEVYCLLNNDIEIIHDDWLQEMVSLAIRDNTGCVGAKLLYPDDTIQHAGVIMGLGGYAAHSHRGVGRHTAGYFNRAQVRQNLSAVTAACLVVRKTVYDEVAGLNEDYSVAYNDVDFCLRVREAGYLNVYTPYAELYHHESKSRGDDSRDEKKLRFDQEKARLLSRWSDVIDHDPYYSPNLTRSDEKFSLL